MLMKYVNEYFYEQCKNSVIHLHFNIYQNLIIVVFKVMDHNLWSLK